MDGLLKIFEKIEDAVDYPQKKTYFEHVSSENLTGEDFVFEARNEFGFSGNLCSVDYNSNQSILAVGNDQGIITLLGRQRIELTVDHGIKEPVSHLSFSVGQSLLLSVCGNKIFSWELNTTDPSIVGEWDMKERITYLHVPIESNWAYIGTEKGNIHPLNFRKKRFSTDIIFWNHLTLKNSNFQQLSPGAVVAIEEHPKEPHKILVGHSAGNICIFDVKKKSIVASYGTAHPTEEELAQNKIYINGELKSLSWSPDGDSFVTGHANGQRAYWSKKLKEKPEEVTLTHEQLQAKKHDSVDLIHWIGDMTMFIGGHEKEENGAFSFTCDTARCNYKKRIVSFVPINTTPWKTDDEHPPKYVLLLLQNRIVLHDLCEPNLPRIQMFYSHRLQSQFQTVSCIRYYSGVQQGLIASLRWLGKQPSSAMYSAQDWPIKGGRQEGTPKPTSLDLVVTGHKNGIVTFWDASLPCLTHLYCLCLQTRCIGLKVPLPESLNITYLRLCCSSRILAIGFETGEHMLLDFGTKTETIRLNVCRPSFPSSIGCTNVASSPAVSRSHSGEEEPEQSQQSPHNLKIGRRLSANDADTHSKGHHDGPDMKTFKRRLSKGLLGIFKPLKKDSSEHETETKPSASSGDENPAKEDSPSPMSHSKSFPMAATNKPTESIITTTPATPTSSVAENKAEVIESKDEAGELKGDTKTLNDIKEFHMKSEAKVGFQCKLFCYPVEYPGDRVTTPGTQALNTHWNLIAYSLGSLIIMIDYVEGTILLNETLQNSESTAPIPDDEVITTMTFNNCYSFNEGEGDTIKPVLICGTKHGGMFFYDLEMIPYVTPTLIKYHYFEDKAPIRKICVLDYQGLKVEPLSRNWVDKHEDDHEDEFGMRFAELGRVGNAEFPYQLISICSAKNIRTLALKNDFPKLSLLSLADQEHNIHKIWPLTFEGHTCFVVLDDSGNLFIFSLPDLQCLTCISTKTKNIDWFRLSNRGRMLMMGEDHVIVNSTLCSKDSHLQNYEDCLPVPYSTQRTMPEKPEGVMSSLFGASNRDDFFNIPEATHEEKKIEEVRKQREQKKQHLLNPNNEDPKNFADTMGQNTQMLQERHEKLSDIDDKSNRLKDNAQQMLESVRAHNRKQASKKWFQI